MIAGKRSTPLLLLAAWAVVGTVAPPSSVAQPGPAPGGIPPRFQTGGGEPPLADAPLAPRAAEAVGPVAPPAAGLPTPVVSIEVGVPAVGNPGQELEYHIVVENKSSAVAHHVTVKDRLPSTARFVKATPEPSPPVPPKDGVTEYVWEFGTMKGGTRKEISLVVKPTGEGDVENTANVIFQHGQKVKTTLSRPQLRVREVGPTQAVNGDTLKYSLEVTNVGTADATHVLLTDTLPDGLSEEKGDTTLRRDLGTIAPGQTRRFEYSATATKNGKWATQVRASADGLQPVDTSTSITIGEPKLNVNIAGPSRRLVSRPATYQITVSNPGIVALTGVKLIDRIPANIDVVSATGRGLRVQDGVQWDLGEIPAGGRKSVRIVLQSAGSGEFNNVPEVRADHQLQARDAMLTRFEKPAFRFNSTTQKWDTLDAPILALEVDKSTDPVDVGGEATYTVRILNPTRRGETNLGLTVELPDELKIVDGRGPTEGLTAKQTITFGKLPALAAGQETTYSVRVQGISAGASPLKLLLTADSLAAPLSQEEPMRVIQSK